MAEFKLTPELIEKIKKVKTVEELITIAKTGGVKLAKDEANEYFEQLNSKSGEIDDEELDNVAGGACSMTAICSKCGAENTSDKNSYPCSECGEIIDVSFLKYRT